MMGPTIAVSRNKKKTLHEFLDKVRRPEYMLRSFPEPFMPGLMRYEVSSANVNALVLNLTPWKHR